LQNFAKLCFRLEMGRLVLPQALTFVLNCLANRLLGFRAMLTAVYPHDARQMRMELGVGYVSYRFLRILPKLLQLDLSLVIQFEVQHARFQRE